MIKDPNKKHKKRVAIKIVKNSDNMNEEEQIEQQIFEKLHKSQKSNPAATRGLLHVYHVGYNHEKAEKYFVTKRLGISLVDIIKRNHLKFSYKQVVSLGCQLISAL